MFLLYFPNHAACGKKVSFIYVIIVVISHINFIVLGEFSGSHNGKHKDDCHLGCCAL
jgi:hypothetical protein